MLGFLSAILAGAAMSVQGVMNTRLGEKVGTLETNAFVQLIGFLLALLIAVFFGKGVDGEKYRGRSVSVSGGQWKPRNKESVGRTLRSCNPNAGFRQ